MGHRANFIVVRENTATAYFDQWAALGCLELLRGGPALAVEVLSEFEQTSQLLDWAFAEGGYLIDFDDQTAIIFGSPVDQNEFEFEEADDDLPLDEEPEEFNPEQYLSQLADAWKGWKLVYDDRGVDAFAEHLQAKSLLGIECQPAAHPADVTPPCEIQA